MVYQVDDQWVAYGTWVANSDCSQMVGIEIKKSDWQPLTDWGKFRAFYFTEPECRLINIDLRSGEQRVVLQEKRWLGHPIYRPFDDGTIAFCHEGPRDAIDARMWLINADGSHMRKVRQHRWGESFTHEFWVPDGSALYYVAHQENDPHRYLYRRRPGNPGKPPADGDSSLLTSDEQSRWLAGGRRRRAAQHRRYSA